ncbi:hypothetical protein [Beijerinckia sp. L45]|uniref:hypothetical protein n=1 Tax=Beijerinckia sp. L45 TaxID=1641855 RepID=UPI00131EBE33|nr:hypothetical protein [Beijerinckia sp. L45]
MSAEAFALAHLAIIVAVLIAIGVAERRGRTRFRSSKGVRYRRLSTAAMLKELRKPK